MAESDTRNQTFTTSSGSHVFETQQKKGEAKDSLSGLNVTKEYLTGSTDKGKLGGMPSHQ
jgi:hypothetical protein